MKHSKFVASLLVATFAAVGVPALASQGAQPQCGDEKKGDDKGGDKKDGDKSGDSKPKAPSLR
ncbi:MAG TPA: hypothetical protein VHP33_36285 [Polyangiaceae bacterium]|nr:hypothetical protein [Polyangiaceae bacterium]